MMTKLETINHSNPEYDIMISLAGEVRKELECDFVTMLKTELQNAA